MKKLLFQSFLTQFEYEEIDNYPNDEIYYLGQDAFMKKIKGIKNTKYNNCYDLSNGKYRIVIDDHIHYRYKILKLLGSGTFSDCYKVLDYKTNTEVAMKIIKNKPKFNRAAKIEIEILNEISKYDTDDCVIKMFDNFVFRNHIIIIFELQKSNLYQIMKKYNFVGFELNVTREIAIDILRTLKLFKNMNIIHADLKPENIVLRYQRDEIKDGVFSVSKVIDVGSAIYKENISATYIQSRYYRSPEVVLGCELGPEIDMWSLGTILVELDSGYPLFPARNETELLLMQIEMFGLFPNYMIQTAKQKRKFFTNMGTLLYNKDNKGIIRYPNTKNIKTKLISTDEHFIDFILKCLIFDPKKRLTVEDALNHPWILQNY